MFAGKGEGEGEKDDPSEDIGSGSFLDAPAVTSTPVKPGQPPSETAGSFPQASMEDLFATGKDMRSPNARKQARGKTKSFTKDDREIAKIIKSFADTALSKLGGKQYERLKDDGMITAATSATRMRYLRTEMDKEWGKMDKKRKDEMKRDMWMEASNAVREYDSDVTARRLA